jgi:hypothetical protein
MTVPVILAIQVVEIGGSSSWLTLGKSWRPYMGGKTNQTKTKAKRAGGVAQVVK